MKDKIVILSCPSVCLP